jgi:spermidine synthase
MQINDENSSAMYLDNDDLVHEYTKYYRLARHFRPGFKHALMIGGAAYSYPKDFLKEYTEATLDVVEIDPKLTKLAEKYFRLKPDSRLRVFHEDARTYLNRTSKKYDVIYGDAFRSFSVPYHLTTREAAQRMHDALNDDGVVLVNLISAVEGDKGRLLRAMLATFKSVFPQVLLYAVDDAEDGTRVQNIMLVALKSGKLPKPYSTDPELNAYLFKTWIPPVPQDMPILTDAYAPVEDYTLPVIVHVRKDRMNPMRERLERFFGKSRVVAIPEKRSK